MKRSLQIAAVVVMAAIAAWAGEQQVRVYRDGGTWVEETTGTMPTAKMIRVDADMGAIRVQGSARSGVSYTIQKRVQTSSEEEARKVFERYRVSAAHHAESLTLEGSGTGTIRARRFNVNFNLEVPREIEVVKLSTNAGSIVANGLNGRIEAESGGGSIHMDDISGSITAETGGGSVDIGNAGGNVKVETGGGSIHVGAVKGWISASTGGGAISIGSATQGVVADAGGGDIEVQKCGGDAKVTTGGGRIDLGDINGKATLETGGGRIRLASARGPVVAQTGAGTIELYNLWQGAKVENGAGTITAEFNNSNQPASDSSLETSMGDVIIYLAPDVHMTVRASIDGAFGHRIRSDFPELKVSMDGGGNYGPRNLYAEGALNGGGPVLKVRTSSGNIEFRRAGK